MEHLGGWVVALVVVGVALRLVLGRFVSSLLASWRGRRG
jgi:hypothetical protein